MVGKRIELSPSDKAKRVRAAGRALQQGVSEADLIRQRGFSREEIVAARELFSIPTAYSEKINSS